MQTSAFAAAVVFCFVLFFLFENSVSMFILMGLLNSIVILIQTWVWWITENRTFNLCLFIINKIIVSGSLWLKKIKTVLGFWVHLLQKCLSSFLTHLINTGWGDSVCDVQCCAPDIWYPNKQILVLSADANTLKALCSKSLHCGINVQMLIIFFLQ